MKLFTIGFLFDDTARVVLIKKKKPEWQNGLLNGVGGKREPGEEFRETQIREWSEETGLIKKYNWKEFIILKGEEFTMYGYTAKQKSMPTLPRTNDVGEEFQIVETLNGTLPLETSMMCVGNLKWMVPMAWDYWRDPIHATIIERG